MGIPYTWGYSSSTWLKCTGLMGRDKQKKMVVVAIYYLHILRLRDATVISSDGEGVISSPLSYISESTDVSGCRQQPIANKSAVLWLWARFTFFLAFSGIEERVHVDSCCYSISNIYSYNKKPHLS